MGEEGFGAGSRICCCRLLACGRPGGHQKHPRGMQAGPPPAAPCPGGPAEARHPQPGAPFEVHLSLAPSLTALHQPCTVHARPDDVEPCPDGSAGSTVAKYAHRACPRSCSCISMDTAWPLKLVKSCMIKQKPLQMSLSWGRHMCCGVQEAQATGPRRRGAVADIHVPEVSILKQVLMAQSQPS